MSKKAIQIDEKDNVVTTTAEVLKGEVVEVIDPDGRVVSKPRVVSDIPFGHKLAIKPLKSGDSVIKYGEIIGVATQEIVTGAWVSTHNVRSARMPTSGKEVGIL